MAGSYRHVTTKEGKYRGPALLDDIGDCDEAILEMWCMIQALSKGDQTVIRQAEEASVPMQQAVRRRLGELEE